MTNTEAGANKIFVATAPQKHLKRLQLRLRRKCLAFQLQAPAPAPQPCLEHDFLKNTLSISKTLVRTETQ